MTSMVSYIIGGGGDVEGDGDTSFDMAGLGFGLRFWELRACLVCIGRSTVSDRSGVGYEELSKDCEEDCDCGTCLAASSALAVWLLRSPCLLRPKHRHYQHFYHEDINSNK
jgi:hypothetical protein